MKKLLIGIFIITLSLNIFATGLAGDIIFINGEQWILLGKPIERDSVLYHNFIGILPEDRSCSTANWDGYTCYWSIKNEKLCLYSVKVTTYNQETKRYHDCSISSADMQRVFKKYYDKDEIIATWVKGTIRVARGEILLYVHSAYARNYEQEQIITLKKGQIKERQSFHNRLVVDGFSLKDLWGQGQEEVKAKLPLKLDDYPELNDVTRIMFKITSIQVDSLGNLVDCKVQAFIWRQGERQEIKELSDQMKNLLKNIYPWKTYLINGQYISRDNVGAIYPYRTRVDIK